MATGEENLAVSKSNSSDTKFDTTIGYIEDIVMEDEFQSLQNDFMDKYYLEFEDTEENKLSYTDRHREYTDLVEKYICAKLTSLMKGFSMEEFQKQLISRKNGLEGEIFEILVTFSDFLAFKEMMLDYRAEKEGRSIDLSSGFMITPLSGPSNGMGIAGTSLSIDGLGPSSNQMTLMDPEDMMTEENGTPRLDCGEPMHEGSNTPRMDTSTTQISKQNTQSADETMESPR